MGDDHAPGPPQAGVFGCDLPPDTALTAEGWEWRCNVDERGVAEMRDTYTELGFEVRLQAVDAGVLCAACDGCKETVAGFKAVYVRKPG
jgi:hypothetical protein